MSRLEQHKSKQAFQRFILFFVIFAALIFLFFNIGIKFLISASLFINQIANNRSKQQMKVESQKLNSVTIDPIASATNSSTLAFSGSALNFDLLEVYINSEKVDELPITDVFSGEVKGLEKGENSIFFIAKSSKSNETKKTQQYNVILKQDKPKIEVTDPQDKSKTSKDDITINGKTDSETTIRINGIPIIVDANGGFSGSVRLKEGENTIEITAEDIAGNSEKKTITVTYAKDD